MFMRYNKVMPAFYYIIGTSDNYVDTITSNKTLSPFEFNEYLDKNLTEIKGAAALAYLMVSETEKRKIEELVRATEAKYCRARVLYEKEYKLWMK